MNYSGKVISFTIKGASHSKYIDLKIKGFPLDKKISLDIIDKDLKRRKSSMFFNTSRKEKDDYSIVQGLNKGEINDKNIKIRFYNRNISNTPYDSHKGFLRPNQSDYAQYLKFKRIEPGGGCFSGRMTLPIVFTGSIAKQLLNERGIEIKSRIKQLGKIEDVSIKDMSIENFTISDTMFPVVDDKKKEEMISLLKEIYNNGSTIGGKIETVIFGYSPGVGGPYFERMESKLSRMIFSIPLVKGVEFGDGFDFVKEIGDEVLDEFDIDSNDSIFTKTNHCGGINGGVTNGMPIIISTAIKPIPTIKNKIKSYNIITKKTEEVEFGGNHDVCAVNRIIPVIESAIAIALYDEMLYEEKD